MIYIIYIELLFHKNCLCTKIVTTSGSRTNTDDLTLYCLRNLERQRVFPDKMVITKVIFLGTFSDNDLFESLTVIAFASALSDPRRPSSLWKTSSHNLRSPIRSVEASQT
jgi:hypothetical protein